MRELVVEIDQGCGKGYHSTLINGCEEIEAQNKL
jgi:hypothetical protein